MSNAEARRSSAPSGPPGLDPDAVPDDAALVRAAQRGDREAFGRLVSRHARSILGLAARMLGPAADADDVAQDTFVAAYKALPGFQRESAFSTWLYRIAVNKCRDQLRARRAGMVSLDATDTGGDLVPEAVAADTPHGELEQMELASELEKGIESLPPLYRESFVLRHVEGLGYDEMSSILGVNRDTLKMRVYKARTLLARALAHLGASSR
jgi:RNA polymerase sigma-70 factor (ECF subfamily)